MTLYVSFQTVLCRLPLKFLILLLGFPKKDAMYDKLQNELYEYSQFPKGCP